MSMKYKEEFKFLTFPKGYIDYMAQNTVSNYKTTWKAIINYKNRTINFVNAKTMPLYVTWILCNTDFYTKAYLLFA